MFFCTLFNEKYLDKGIALFKSLEKNAPGFHLYALSMDDITYDVLSDIKSSNLTPVKLSDFENEALLSVKPSRKLGEYFWTCSSWLISYVLDTYKPEYCTYVDADLFIFSNPEVIIEEMKRRGASVQIVSHRFMDLIDEHATQAVGKFCVEFNTFKNDENGRALLNIWKKQVLDNCTVDHEKGFYGDQKYLNNWLEEYPYVIDTDNVGAGVGPWNLCCYNDITKKKDKDIIVSRWGKKAPLLFVHFENINYLNESSANVSLVHTWKSDKKFIDKVYVPYLQLLRRIKADLKDKYGIYTLIQKHPGYVTEAQRDGIFKRLYKMIFVDKRLLHSILTNLLISVPNKLFKRYSVVNF